MWIPKNYKPIACLLTTLKVTSIITDRLCKYLENESVMTSEQREERKIAMDANTRTPLTNVDCVKVNQKQ